MDTRGTEKLSALSTTIQATAAPFVLVFFFLSLFSSFSFSPLFQDQSETIKKRSSKTADPLSRRTQRAGVGQTKGWGVTGRLLHNRKEMCNTRILHPPLRVISCIERCADKMCSFIESCLRNFLVFFRLFMPILHDRQWSSLFYNGAFLWCSIFNRLFNDITYCHLPLS